MEIANPNRVAASTLISKPMALTNTRRELDGLRKLDPQAVAAIYDRYFPDVYRYVYYRLGNESLAEDIASDVFVRLLEAVKAKRGPKTNLKSWLLSTASNVIADHLRRVYRRPTEVLSEAMPDLGSSLTDEVDRRHQADSVREAYAQLTPEQQNVLALRFGDGCSLEETAAVMQKKVNAVKALQFRALAALQRHIGEVSYE
jgi:RNA polymerase sigma-70 factor (ECF subfamily)